MWYNKYMPIKFEIKGLDIVKTNLKRVVDRALTGAEAGVKESSEKLYGDVLASMGGTGWKNNYIGVNRKFAKGQAQPGSGLEMPAPPGRGSIGVRTGRMRSSLRRMPSKTNTSVSSEIGYSKTLIPKTPPGRATRNKVDWPRKKLFVGKFVVTSKKGGNKWALTKYITGMQPGEYVPAVLLGNEKIVGRNVLRLALVMDILQRRTIRAVENNVKRELKKK